MDNYWHNLVPTHDALSDVYHLAANHATHGSHGSHAGSHGGEGAPSATASEGLSDQTTPAQHLVSESASECGGRAHG